MILLSDLGGFQGAIILLPSYLMSFYASRMLSRSLASQTPTVKRRYGQNTWAHDEQNVLKSAQESGLSISEVKELLKATK